MRLPVGTILGTYEVVGLLGAGGMGEVYRARDVTLDRDVALKIVNHEFCAHPDSRARLRREARAQAALIHPHIAAVHEFGESDSGCFIVMEYVPGEPLSAVLKRERLRPPAALRIAAQICGALEAAHEKGLIHRDLKPANIRLTLDGIVKVLDFGLARQTGGGDVDTAATGSAFASRVGEVAGTPAYMSPEQARGQFVDRRTDIWSFGCVLYEMLAGRQAFCAPSSTDLLVAIIDRDPEWSHLPADTPLIARRLLRRCLEKDVARRLRDIGDARLEIEEALTPGGAVATESETHVLGGRRRWAAAAVLLVAGVVLGALLASTLWSSPPETASTAPPARFVVPLVGDTRFVATDFPTLAISPDGALVAYTATRGDRTQLFLRPLNGHEATPVPGSANAVSPFFSPDSQWIAFFADGRLKKMPVGGGPPVIVCDAAIGFGGTWGADDTIVFAPAPGSPLWRVPAAGGTPVRLTQLDGARGEFSHRWPEFLPDGRTVLFTVGTQGSWDDAEIVAESIDSGQRQRVVEGGTHPRYLASGHLLFVRHGAAWVVPFDAERLRVAGSPVSVLDDVLVSFDGAGQISVSPRGTLVYIAGSAFEPPRRLIALDASGATAPLAAEPRAYAGPRVSPEGRRIVVSIAGAAEEVWLYDIGTGALEQLTFESVNRAPIWTPDGKRITFSSNRAGALNLFLMDAEGLTAPERLTTSDNLQLPGDWSPDGAVLAYVEHHPQTGRDIWLLRQEHRSRETQAFVTTQFDETAPAFSPDGRWIAYVSNESGRNEIWVRAVEASSQAAMVTREGGSEPVWSRDGRELFYRSADRLMSVAITPGTPPRAGRSRVVFEGPFEAGTADRANYDVGTGARSFILLGGSGQPTAPGEFHVLLNWTAAGAAR
jgi:eukaryotic-like serine/threonine-protein kinase